MSKSNHHNSEADTGSAAATWWITGAVCLLVFGGIFWLTGPGRAPTVRDVTPSGQASAADMVLPEAMSWPGLIVDAGALERERAAQLEALNLEELTTHPASEQLREVVKAINDHQFTTHPIPSRTMDSMEQELGVAISEALTLVDAKRFVALGEPLFEACDRGLKEVQSDLATGEASLQKVIDDADFERYGLYRKHCGNMLGELRARGLVDDRGQWKDDEARAMGKILQRYRWAHLVRLYVDPLMQLTPLERRIFVRWRVEQSEAFALEDRERFLPALKRYYPDYPEGVAEAMLAYERGEKKNAAEILSRYRNQSPDNRTYRVMYESLSEELANQ